MTDRQTDGQTDGQKAMHKSPPCNRHRWAQKAISMIILCHGLLSNLLVGIAEPRANFRADGLKIIVCPFIFKCFFYTRFWKSFGNVRPTHCTKQLPAILGINQPWILSVYLPDQTEIFDNKMAQITFSYLHISN